MQKKKKPSAPNKLLISVERLRPLGADKLREVIGGACPKSRPVHPD